MPLYKTKTIDPKTKLLIWKITESVDELKKQACLTKNCQLRLEELKSEEQQKQFLSIRCLLGEIGYSAIDLNYSQNGKPHLVGKDYISITHSYHFAGIIISRKPAGIDLEKQRDKILRIASKFTPLQEYKTLANHEAIIRKLTIVWGAKEAVYKILDIPGLSFLNDIDIRDFDFGKTNSTIAEVHSTKKLNFMINFFEFEGFTCVYALYS